jgi:hypothetical protein
MSHKRNTAASAIRPDPFKEYRGRMQLVRYWRGVG